jgi:hypothetical protein
LAHAFLWKYGYKGLKLAQLLGQLGVFLACAAGTRKMRHSTDFSFGFATAFAFDKCLFGADKGAAART